MDHFLSPIRYDDLLTPDLQAHLRHCAATFKDGDRAEFLLCDTGVVIPVTKRVFRTKPATLVFLARSGSVGRGALVALRSRFEAEGYDLRAAVTPKQRLLSRFEISLSTDDAILPAMGVAVFSAIASQIGSAWPQTLSAGYIPHLDGSGLPGRLTIESPVLRVARNLGRQLGAGYAQARGRRR